MNDLCVGTELKWTSNTAQEMYREAIVTEEGIKQIRYVHVEPSIGRHNTAECMCVICWVNRVGEDPRKSKENILFKDISAWVKSLPTGGTVKVTMTYLQT